nr:MAG TPA: hypothetical protein [Bacteriophage sp.]DAX88308.1 MAG TPA: hypothetical protein [Caudoviricetes sp.]
MTRIDKFSFCLHNLLYTTIKSNDSQKFKNNTIH